MALMIPDIDPNKIENKGERLAYKALSEQLPEDWIVRYHYPACWMQGNRLKECEADFVVLAPHNGILFLEVKGSRGYESVDGVWYRINQYGERVTVNPSPWDQATSTKHQIVKQLAIKLGFGKKNDFPGLYGHLVLYPNGRRQGSLPTSIDPALVLDNSDMGSLAEKLQNAFNLWSDEGNAECWYCHRPYNKKTDIALGKKEQFTIQVMARIIEFLKDDCQYIAVVSPEVDEDEEVIEELTQQQYRAFNQLLGNDRILTKGTAGSGKTMIAFWTANSYGTRTQGFIPLL